uniref:Ubiquitin-like protease family profile domain-containing protein n=1 Tax=Panagrolaimus sp. ES5 TaxID=591445 RepID=A0AC34GVB0_9BILA
MEDAEKTAIEDLDPEDTDRILLQYQVAAHEEFIIQRIRESNVLVPSRIEINGKTDIFNDGVRVIKVAEHIFTNGWITNKLEMDVDRERKRISDKFEYTEKKEAFSEKHSLYIKQYGLQHSWFQSPQENDNLPSSPHKIEPILDERLTNRTLLEETLERVLMDDYNDQSVDNYGIPKIRYSNKNQNFDECTNQQYDDSKIFDETVNNLSNLSLSGHDIAVKTSETQNNTEKSVQFNNTFKFLKKLKPSNDILPLQLNDKVIKRSLSTVSPEVRPSTRLQPKCDGGNENINLVDKYKIPALPADYDHVLEAINYQTRGRKQCDSYAFGTYFYTMMKNRQNYDKLVSWTKVNLFDFEVLFWPICSEKHWFLFVADSKNRNFFIYDSLYSGKYSKEAEQIEDFLKYYSSKRNLEIQWNEWKTNPLPEQYGPKQSNGVDCAIFLCQYAKHLTKQAKIDFTQAGMENYRKIMLYELLNGELLP